MTDVTTLKSAGNSANRVDIVLVAEGYTAAERDKFLADSQRFTDYLFNVANKAVTDPFYTYRSFINVHAAYTASQQSGYDANGVLVNTAFDAAAYLADGRLVYGDSNKVQTFVNSVLRPDQQEMIIVLVNSDKYGGAGALWPGQRPATGCPMTSPCTRSAIAMPGFRTNISTPQSPTITRCRLWTRASMSLQPTTRRRCPGRNGSVSPTASARSAPMRVGIIAPPSLAGDRKLQDADDHGSLQRAAEGAVHQSVL